MKKWILIIIISVIAVAAALWYFFLRTPSFPGFVPGTATETPGGFNPFNRPSAGTRQPVTPEENTPLSTTTPVVRELPILRQLSATPVGGYGASTTATTTVIRWIDRGRGNIYEAAHDTSEIATISNTLLPRVYKSWWDKNLVSFVGQYLAAKDDTVTTISSAIQKRPSVATTTASSTPSTEAPYELKGRIVSGDVIAVAASPAGNKMLTVINEDGRGVGYTSNFDGTGKIKVFDTPMTQVTADWPEENTVVLATKASAAYGGYVYFVNVRTGAIRQVLGGLPGLGVKVSADARRILFSTTAANGRVTTGLYDVESKKTSEVLFRTLADKCVWSSKFKKDLYCAVPLEIKDGIYPDDWYIGSVFFVDSIWRMNAGTGEVQQVAKLLDLARTVIDAINLELDEKDDYLGFINKNDLSLWSLDLLSAQ